MREGISGIRVMRTGCLILCVLLFQGAAAARDINLDRIYLSQGSPYLKKINEAKLDSFAAASARIADTGVSFCGWSTGSAITYVRDLESRFDVYEYYLSSRMSRKIASGRGAVVYAEVSMNGKYLFAKSLAQRKGSPVPESIFSVISLRTGEVREQKTAFPFIDFSSSPFGISYIRDEKEGVVEFFPDTKSQKTLLAKNRYASIVDAKEAVVPFLSPDAEKIALINGGGGRYTAYIFDKGNSASQIDSVSSAAEFRWIGSRNIAYRTGYPGNFRLMLYSLSDRKSQAIGARTFNTNLSYAPYNGMIAFLQDGCVSFYSVETKTLESFPVEGEDLSFSPDGNNFCSLFGGRIFILHREGMKGRSIELKRAASRLEGLYREAKKDIKNHANEFSAEYCERKELIYRSFAK